MSDKKKVEKEETKFSEDMMESIKAVLEEFEKISGVCHATPEDMVGLLFKAYDEGWYGSQEAKEEVILRLLREFVESQFKETTEKKSTDSSKKSASTGSR